MSEQTAIEELREEVAFIREETGRIVLDLKHATAILDALEAGKEFVETPRLTVPAVFRDKLRVVYGED